MREALAFIVFTLVILVWYHHTMILTRQFGRKLVNLRMHTKNLANASSHTDAIQNIQETRETNAGFAVFSRDNALMYIDSRFKDEVSVKEMLEIKPATIVFVESDDRTAEQRQIVLIKYEGDGFIVAGMEFC